MLTRILSSKSHIKARIGLYGTLLRLDKPIGTFLLWWPTLWALWLAADGRPSLSLVVLFSMGVWVMRAAGCVINDYCDRDLDGQVARTAGRPLATQEVSVQEAQIILVVLLLLAALIVLPMGWQTVLWALVGLVVAMIYPLMKRVTHWPQVVLSIAFNWGIPLAYIATRGYVGVDGWFLFGIAAIWTVMYDTLYAMTDRCDDIRVGIKSTAVVLQHHDKSFIAILQFIIVLLWLNLGYQHGWGWMFYGMVAWVALLFVYQLYLIRDRAPEACFAAFLNNHWVGAALFIGICGATL